MVVTHTIVNAYSILVVSSPVMAGEYCVWDGDTQLQAGSGQGGFGPGGMGGMRPPEGGFGERPDFPNGMEPPAGGRPSRPQGGYPSFPEGMEPPEGDWGGMPTFGGGNNLPI